MAYNSSATYGQVQSFNEANNPGYQPYPGDKYDQDQGPPPPYSYGQPTSTSSNANPAAYAPPPQPAVYPRDPETSTGFNAISFSDKAIRRAFIKKVYLILTAQLLVTFGFIALFIFVKPIKHWVQRDGLWFYIVAYCAFLVTYFVLICCPSVRRQSPGNFICLSIFTVAFSYLTGTISSHLSFHYYYGFHDTKIVLLAAGITGAVCFSISLFAIQTKIDFTMCSGLLFALVMVLFFFGWACLISYYAWGYNSILNSVYAGLGALVFALVSAAVMFLIYDTQMIMGGKKMELSPEEYIYGALQLYIDVVYIFIFLLSLMGKSN